MILIEDILVSEDITQEHFACNLTACKGACCVEGDFGAPLEEEELSQIARILEKVKPFMPKESVDKLEASGFYSFDKKRDVFETTLMEDGACVFMGRDPLGITYCAMESAHRAGETDFKKPISCHLYPVRVHKNRETGFEALNYDRWDICNPACASGRQKGIRIYEFVRDALIRKYGNEFYAALEAAATDL